MGHAVVHFEIIGKDPDNLRSYWKDPDNLRSYYGGLFGWEFDTSSQVSGAVSEPTNYGFVHPGTTSDGSGIPGGVGGGLGYDPRVIFYVGVSGCRGRAPEGREPRRDSPDGPRRGPREGPCDRPLHGSRGQPDRRRR
jgi:hypothetical protein